MVFQCVMGIHSLTHLDISPVTAFSITFAYHLEMWPTDLCVT